MMPAIDLSKYRQVLTNDYRKHLGKVVKVVGLTVESIGPKAKLNDLCYITSQYGQLVMAEVVGFRGDRVLLMPYGNVEGVGPGSFVENTNESLQIKVGMDLLGKSLDGLGKPLDGSEYDSEIKYPVEQSPPDPMSRKMIDEEEQKEKESFLKETYNKKGKK